ncbi:MAG: YceI family protein [Flavobacterium sp.]|uniref:YceI family protein n=1 Tax=Flavobacterium sp. TaxID=239 RepID=UPI0032673F5E
MKKTITTGILALAMFGAAYAQNTKWNIDKSHSSINFAVDHLVISETTGKFEEYSVNTKSDRTDFTDVVFDFTAQIKSVNTDDAKRDEHLKSADFFDEKNYPVITFKSKKFIKIKGNAYKVTGDLTMHGITKTVTLSAKFGGIIKDPWGGTRAGLKVFGEIDRYDFGLKYNSVLEAGGLSIGQMIRITCNIELIKV